MTLDRIKGALFGHAIGDALGGTTEFMTEKEVQEKFGRVSTFLGGGKWRLKPGETTDDTAMTLALARGIISNPEDPVQEIADQFINWLNSEPKDIGMRIHYALSYLKNGEKIENAAEFAQHDLGGSGEGNGSLMRCLPISLYCIEEEKVAAISEAQSQITHASDVASEACVLYNLVGYDIMCKGIPLKEALTERITGTRYEQSLYKVPDVYPTKNVVHTFSWVIYVLMQSDSYLEVVQTLANKGNDADTTAAIAGGLSGLDAGYRKLPQSMAEQLLKREEINIIAGELLKIRTASETA
ncbi:ADP-ribosylglycohydrolase family protein [Alkalicoccus daliensis]|uniref:ADP-ribosyl-[dinitrogen reductase] hydrolase n=1 Tax=Alkalicoccus daliensis TaxID=745820 RepID=A0A1H0HVS9_9BACI|nr:ADP-ribosylglycohydrolase family protein [Alkalicoccus daliensis]SDO23308.1 ADP-ribosyl-[dinitrogen reductase] hydrolase [Alkalicoccus daliensis]